ncbi:MAG: hypothetical protein Phog2KO_49410 [Phototrophicaceae bacterium]
MNCVGTNALSIEDVGSKILVPTQKSHRGMLRKSFALLMICFPRHEYAILFESALEMRDVVQINVG